MREIREWLENGQDYAQGVALYETHGSSRVVLSALQFGNTEFTRQKLRAELGKLLAVDRPGEVAYAPPHVSISPKKRSIEQKPQRTKADESRQKEDESRQKEDESGRKEPAPELADQRRAWFAERHHLHPQLGLVGADDERLAMALRILELSDLITESYAGEASPAAATPGLRELEDEGEMRRLLNNLRPQRTKLKKRADRAADLACVEATINLLETKLKKRDGGEPQLQPGD